MDIYELLHDDHQAAKAKMKAIVSAKGEERSVLTRDLIRDVMVHARTKEAVFYSRLHQEPQLKQLLQACEAENERLRDLFVKISMTPSDDEGWMEVFSDIKYLLSHHIMIEESKIFPVARTVLTSKEATQLAADLQALKDQEPMPLTA